MSIHPYHGAAVFDHFVADAMGQLPPGVTFARLTAARGALLTAREYQEELQLHNIGNVSIYWLRDRDPAEYLHLKGNFWSMVARTIDVLRENGLR